VTVNPNASISGNVTIGAGASLGTCASVIQGRRVGRDSVLGAGAVVVRDLPARVVAVGVPARPLDGPG
jgi:acetyltransferase-like isoleucine patch superfamily enzyme